ncbi:MAG TPA: N-acetylmuramoyl-L-alanine amidase [Bauldia sp.]|nr:N-acetylmuramoyl-L-alanine amidase [Bauldia sp.]
MVKQAPDFGYERQGAARANRRFPEGEALIEMRAARHIIALLAVAAGALLAVAAPGAEAPETPESKAPLIFDARIVGDEARTRFIADMTGVIGMSVFTLSDPYRVIVDIPEVRFGLDDEAGQAGRGMFTAFRYGQISPGKSRIVLDLAGPAKVDKAFVVPPAENQPARLVIDVIGTSREEFLQVERAFREARSIEEAAKRDRAIVAPPVADSSKFNVVLDPGHGGIDTGAKGKAGAVEKVVTLEFAELLRRKLEATGRYNVFLTRTDDRFVALGDRVAMARSHGADLFVSIHANSFRGRSIRGTIVYTISEGASDALASEIAASENQADALAGLDLSAENSDEVLDILFDLTRRETRNFEMVFARNLVKELRQTTGMFKVPHQKAGFKVLTAHDFPSAMIELGFVSNPEDEKLLLSNEWREKMANSVVRAIDAYFETKLAQGNGQ